MINIYIAQNLYLVFTKVASKLMTHKIMLLPKIMF